MRDDSSSEELDIELHKNNPKKRRIIIENDLKIDKVFMNSDKEVLFIGNATNNTDRIMFKHQSFPKITIDQKDVVL